MLKTILIVAFIILPGALFMADMASGVHYQLDHNMTARTHQVDPHYDTIHTKYDLVGACIGALPGAAILVAVQTSDARKRRRLLTLSARGTTEREVWPPSPNDKTWKKDDEN